jgi:vitamin K-dependent gamma-carboxylase
MTTAEPRGRVATVWRRPSASAALGERLREAGRRPVSSASLAVFRIAFGVAMVINTMLYLPVLVREYYIDPPLHFPYPPFAFVVPLPGPALYGVFGLMVLTGAMIALGLLYRWAAWSFFVLTTYVFLLDSTYYQNHEYLVSLLALMLALLPADRRWSLDARRRPGLRSMTVPAWVVWLLRFQIGVPYFFGGIAKLNGDWFRGEPLRAWLANRTDLEPMATVLTTEWVVWFMAYGALVLDLTVVWFLLHRRTRPAAYAVVVCFHLMNAWLFGLFIFPWLMIAATTIFFSPAWPERLVRRFARPAARVGPTSTVVPVRRPVRPWRPSRALVGVFGVWVLLQATVPLRHFAIAGSPSWTEEAHRFAWHMRLRQKSGTATFLVTANGQTWTVEPSEHLSGKQLWQLAGYPERLVRFAHHLSELHGGAEVRAETRVSLNGREPQPIVDPSVDLSEVSLLWFGPAPWILPLETPLNR